jgi:hypothetical protein
MKIAPAGGSTEWFLSGWPILINTTIDPDS